MLTDLFPHIAEWKHVCDTRQNSRGNKQRRYLHYFSEPYDITKPKSRESMLALLQTTTKNTSGKHDGRDDGNSAERSENVPFMHSDEEEQNEKEKKQTEKEVIILRTLFGAFHHFKRLELIQLLADCMYHGDCFMMCEWVLNRESIVPFLQFPVMLIFLIPFFWAHIFITLLFSVVCIVCIYVYNMRTCRASIGLCFVFVLWFVSLCASNNR